MQQLRAVRHCDGAPIIPRPRPALDLIMFPKNEHSIERAVRVILGLGILSLVFVGPESPWGWLGLVPLSTGLIGSCPLYTMLGISTCPTHRQAAH